MTVSDLQDVLDTHDGTTELEAVSGLPWRTLACTALQIVRSQIKLDGEQSAAWDVVQSLLCG